MKKATQTLKINEQVKFDINNHKEPSLDGFTEITVTKDWHNDSNGTIHLKLVNGLLEK